MPRGTRSRTRSPITAAIAAVAFATGLAETAARAEGCGRNAVCTVARNHEFIESRDVQGRLAACAVVFYAQDIDRRRFLSVTLMGGEGPVLPYLRYFVVAADVEGDAEPRRLPLAAIRIVDGEREFDSKSWLSFATPDGLAHARTDVLPEDRAAIGRAGKRSTSGHYGIAATYADGTVRFFGVAHMRERNDVADKFADCMETLRRDVGG